MEPINEYDSGLLICLICDANNMEDLENDQQNSNE